MTETRIKISSIVENQLPQFVLEEFPLVSEFLSQYYASLEGQGNVSDILQNIDQYIKVDQLTNLVDSTVLTSDVTFFDSAINVSSTAGFPDSYGLLLIDSEIITYTSKTSTTFEGCVRGFSGVTSYKTKDQLTFTETESQEHSVSATVSNLSILFLKEFLLKVKKQVTPGFENRELYSELNEGLFIKQSIDFYSSKGTDNSFKILFGALYGQNVEVIKPRDYLIQPSNAQYRITSDLVVEEIEGNPEDLVNETLYQKNSEGEVTAQGTVTKVEKIRRGDKDYYTLSLDSDYSKDIGALGTIFGNFTVQPKTKTVLATSLGSNTLEVDSTVGFPQTNGTIVVNLENQSSLNITYTKKTLNQFLGCVGINQDIPESTEIKTNEFASSRDERTKIRIMAVLSGLNLPDNTRFYSEEDTIKIKTLGIDLKDYKSNNWFFNIPVKYEVKSIDLLDSSDKSYRINLYDDHFFKVGNSVTLLSSSGVEYTGFVVSFINEKSFSIQLGSESSLLDTSIFYIVKKNISKVSSQNYLSVNQYTSNVQNVYYEDEESIYVSSPSLPSYLNQSLKINDRSVTFSGTFSGTTLNIGPHGLYSGDSIVYKPTVGSNLGISSGVYFIKKVSDTQVKLARSRANIFTENFVSVNGTVLNETFELSDFTYNDLSTQLLESQKLIRKISSPENDGNSYETNPGLTGIFVNGVEVLNYKAKDNVYYGPIQKIIPVSPGSDYDIINPPNLTIIDPVGSGATANCSIIGGLERIDVVDPGFDYLEEPKINITGGNGSGASAIANLISFDYSVPFNSQGSADLVKLNPTNKIGFSSHHRFRDAEEVVYVTDGQISVGGLSTSSSYYVSVQDAFNVKLHKSFSDAVSGINTIQLTSYGIGNHSFRSKEKKRKIGSITVTNKGSNYQNKLTTTSVSGINTSLDVIKISEHGYQSGEIIVYNATETPIGGLSSNTSYYITRVNDDEFKLSQIGISTLGITTSFYYNTKQYINLTSSGSGIHKFNYPEIEVSVKGKIGVSTLTGQDFNAVVQPVFRGEIQSVFVQSGGQKYGSEEIINHNRQPLFELNSGSGIQLTPIISNGRIVDVLINSRGSGYNSPPTLQINGSGFGALLTPVFSNGSLLEVKIINGGAGYNSSNTFIDVIPAGSNAKLEAQIKSWKINLIERLIQNSQITEDDGILAAGLNSDYGLEYTHAYAPRYLRSSVQGSTFRNGQKIYVQDLQLLNNKELTSTAHSPIVGWAYDGNPIYGPYGYSSKTGGSVKCLVPGYVKKENISSDLTRPNTSIYPEGFFVEDYVYNQSGDLDEHNGRFGVTPEYPNGIYAYFTTIDSGLVESSGLFENYKKPVFPYVIGPTYKSKPIDFNFKTISNQDTIDINQTGWRRNISPYNISLYDYILNPNSIKSQNSIVKNTSTGSIDSIGIETGGQNYKIGDSVVFSESSAQNAKAIVSLLKGKSVNQISVATSSFDDVEFYPYNQEFIGFTSIPHNYLNRDLVTFTGKYDYKKSGNITVNANSLSLTTGIGSAQQTGIVTYFNITGNLSFPNIKENDIYQIENEDVKVLNIDKQSSRIRVLRNQNGTTGLTSYSSGTVLIEKTRKFKLNFGISTSYNFDLDNELYFDPKESVGLGTTSGVGIVSTLYFSNPGVGITQLTIPTQSIYIREHNLNTGDSLIYSSNGGTRISVSTDGSSSFVLDEKSIVYVAKISNDLIGISTIKVGLGSTGNFVAVGSSTQSGILYFTSVGTGSTHSFKTNYTNTLIGQISKNVVTVSTAETHGLSLSDNVEVNVKPGVSTTFVVKYNDYNRRLIINPKTFSSIDTVNNIITINNHGYYTGQKVIYTATTPASGLINEGIYYVVVIDSNKIKLSNTYYQATKLFPEIVIISSSQPGTISQINPPLSLIKNQKVIFDLSDSSLSFIGAGVTYSAFDFKIYKDNLFKTEFDTTESSSLFELVKNGNIGIDSTAKITLTLNDKVPPNLYYNLVPANLNSNLQIKKELIVDTEVLSNNQISLVESGYNGTYSIVGVSSTSFKYNILETPESSSYTTDIEYYTNSKSALGPIERISLLDKGRGYRVLPGITSVSSNTGTGAILNPNSDSIGKITTTEIQDIGFEYPSDYSIRPTAKLPEILILDSLSTFDYIGISSFGRNYNSIPNLVVIDGLTNKVIEDVDLTYNFGDSRVTILKNSTELSKVTPKIIPTNNSNGIKIKNIVFNSATKDVTVTLGSSFSDPIDFPFFVGEKVLVEGTSVGIATTGKGFNSAKYNYSLFTIKSVDANIGGIGATVSYSLSEYLSDGETPGTFNSFYSSGRIIPQSQFPIFNSVLKKNNFYVGESVYSSSSSGSVISWDPINQYLKVSTVQDFKENELLRGETSGSTALIKSIISLDLNYSVDSYSKVAKGWNTETGFLNNNFQRIHDNDYYQYFSYDIRSQKDLNTWDNVVSNLNHTAGFKKFSNLIIESDSNSLGISTEQNQGDFSGTADLSRFVDLNCVFDFDLAKENNLNIDGNISSDEIVFNSRLIQDYIESVGNRVLMIDDISNEFNSNPRLTTFGVVDSFVLNDFRSQKYIVLVKDRRFSNEIQISLVSLIHDGDNGFINQYGINSTKDLGFFDFNISGSEGNLLFYPVNFKSNDYYTSNLSISLNDVTSGVGTTDLGTSVRIHTDTSTISTGTSTSTTIVGISSTYRTSKVLVQIGATDSSYYEYDEITYVHNGSDVLFLEYGQVTTDSVSSKSISGLGTYNAYISGNDVVIDLIPDSTTTVDYVVNTFNVSLANTSLTGIGTQTIGGATLDSSSVSIASSSSPLPNVIASYSNTLNNCSYSIISVEDKTNLQYQVSEFLTITDTSTNKCYILEFGNLNTSSSLGITTAGISGSNTNTYFTPIENIDVDIKVFQTALYLSDDSSEILLTNGGLHYDYGTYTATENDIKKSFNLKHKNLPIFQRYFDGSSSSVVNTSTDIIRIPNHFFVTGEEINYSYSGSGSGSIGIATTSIAGIGTTDKLPSTLYVVKINDLDIRVASSASNALKSVPNWLDINSVGIGNSHIFTSKNQNKKSIISIDNVIQSPVASSAVTTNLVKNVSVFQSEISVSGITSIFGGDLLKVDDEIMRVASVGVGSTNTVSVLRPWLGTKLSSHTSSTLVTKVLGNYNIIDNVIYFDEAPYGKVPILNPTSRADEVDYIGIETGSTFTGRVFLRSGEENTSTEPYTKNYIFDDISNDFNGIDKTFALKSGGSNVTGVSTDNAIVLVNSIFQGPNATNVIDNYDLEEKAGITTITFVGTANSTNYDINTASIPRGGIILSVGSTQGFGYQPLVAAGGTAIVSSAGTIQSISIGNSGSGYRVGIQTIVNVGVKTESTGIPNIQFIGTASVSNGHIVSVAITNPGIGYTSSNPPIVVFDSPLSYSNLPVIYSSQSSTGVGTGAVVDIVVGQGSSIISFELKNLGYGYKQNDILTVSTGGISGIPTDTSLSFSEFQITVDRVQSDRFSAWSVGRLQVIDPLDALFDGTRRSFPILINSEQTTIRSRKGSNIDVQATLLVFINDILQVPGQGYTFNGGSIIRFAEAPKEGDTSRILFYRGTSDLDTQSVDILETIKVGDNVLLKDDTVILTQDDRVVTDVISSDSINTNLYAGPGITQNEDLLRPLTWCRQTEDRVVDGFYVGKDRTIYEPYIQPSSNIIENVGIGTTIIYVESVKTFFDSEREYVHDGTTEKPQNKIIIVSQDSVTSAAATAVVSTSGTISSIAISDGGVGYTTSPVVTIASPIGFGTTAAQNTAKASATISGGVVTGIAITIAGLGYSSVEPPMVLIEPPALKYEIVDKVSYEGDFGDVIGFGTTTISGSTVSVFDLYIPNNSYLRDSSVVGTSITISQLNVGDFFVIKNSNVGIATTQFSTYRNDNSLIGISTQFVDGIYQVSAVQTFNTFTGIANTYVKRVFAKSDISLGISFAELTPALLAKSFDSSLYTFDSDIITFDGEYQYKFYGQFSWGKIMMPDRNTSNSNQFNCYGFSGIDTSASVSRFNRLKFVGYST